MAMKPSRASWSATPRIQSLRPKISWITITTPALSFRSGYAIQARIGGRPASIFTSTYSPWRGDDSRAALAVSSGAGRLGSRGGRGLAGAGGACIVTRAKRRMALM